MTSTIVDWSRRDLPEETAHGICMVEFYAPWCVLSENQRAVLLQLAAEFDASIRVGRVNVEAAPAVAADYGIGSLPTVLVLKEGREFTRLVGLQSGLVLGQVLQSLL